MKTFSFANQKGGVGKSTFAVHKAIAHADDGDRVLFIDLDGQCNSTASLKSRARIAANAIQLFEKTPLQSLESTPGITLIQGTRELNEIERLPNDVVLQPKVHLSNFSDRFDFCIIDTPPTLGLRLIASLVLADFVVCPFELSGYSIQGITQMIQTINGIKANLNPNLEFLGMLPNRVNSRSTAHKEAIKDLYANFSDHIIKQPMVNRVSVQEANDSGRAVWELKTGAARIAGKEMLSALNAINELAKKGARP